MINVCRVSYFIKTQEKILRKLILGAFKEIMCLSDLIIYLKATHQTCVINSSSSGSYYFKRLALTVSHFEAFC